jgi:hypothetical protein
MGKISYPFDKMYSASQQVDNDSTEGLSKHNQNVQKLLDSVHQLPPILRDRLVPQIDTWDKKVQQQYSTYSTLATRLCIASASMEAEDSSLAQGFKAEK